MDKPDLRPKQTPLIIRSVYICALFIAVFAGFMYLYGYLWAKFSTVVVRSLSRDFYIQATGVPCSIDADCVGACDLYTSASQYRACLCLKGSCRHVENTQHFSASKYCEQDTDCTVSCYEGPVSSDYYERVGGVRNDCSDGCIAAAFLKPSNTADRAVCKNRQCQFESGQTCFIGTMKQQ